jgi:hypothetical protein
MMISVIGIEQNQFLLLVMNNVELYDETELLFHVYYFGLMIDIVLKHWVEEIDLALKEADFEKVMKSLS